MTGNCDRDGCDYNSYRLGNTTFFGPNQNIDTTQPFTVTTQFYTDSTGQYLTEIRYFFSLLNFRFFSSKHHFSTFSILFSIFFFFFSEIGKVKLFIPVYISPYFCHFLDSHHLNRATYVVQIVPKDTHDWFEFLSYFLLWIGSFFFLMISHKIVRRFYVQNGKKIGQAKSTYPTLSKYDSITDPYCTASKTLFGVC